MWLNPQSIIAQLIRKGNRTGSAACWEKAQVSQLSGYDWASDENRVWGWKL